jgi:phage terminase large subunit-like protein
MAREVIGAVDPRYRPPVGHLYRPAASIQRDTPAALQQQWEAVRWRRILDARADFRAFMEYAIQDSETGAPVELQWFHEEWCDAMDAHPRVCIVAPRSHGKSTVIIARVVWELGRNPNLRIKIACEDQPAAVKRLGEIKRHIEKNPRVREVFPHLRPGDLWSKTQITVERGLIDKDPSVEAQGVLGGATGGRCDLLIGDDVVGRRNALTTPALRDAVKQAWYADWLNLAGMRSRVWVICTLWHNCLPSDAPVPTENGVFLAGSITTDSRLRVGPGAWENPRAITRRSYDGQIFNITIGACTDALRCTPDHRWPTRRGDVSAADLRVGDWVRLDIDPVNEWSVSDAEHIGPHPEPEAERVETGHHPSERLASTVEWVQTCIGDGMSYAEIGKRAGRRSGKSWTNSIVRRFGLRPRSARHVLRRSPGALPEFWRLCGYYCAEGDINAHNNAVRLVFGYNAEERQFVADAVKCVRSALGVRVAVHHLAHATVVQFSCRSFSDWCKKTFGKLSENIRLPAWFGYLPRHLIDAWMLGYWNGDGSHSPQMGQCAARFGTVSMSLAYDLRRLIPAVYNVPAAVYRSKKKNSQDCFDVRSSDVVLKEIGANIVPTARSRTRKSRAMELRDGAQWMRVRKISQSRWRGEVVDVATSTGYFDACMATSHNSDLNHELRDNAEWHTVFQAIDGYASVWPDGRPEAWLREKRALIGATEYARGFANKPQDESDSPVDASTIEYVPAAAVPPLEDLDVYASYDVATETAERNDFTTEVVIGIHHPSRTVFVLDAEARKVTRSRQSAWVHASWKRWRPSRILIESIGNDLALWVLNDYPALDGIVERVKNLQTAGSKLQRLTAVTPFLERGQVVFLDHLDPANPAFDPSRGNLIEELVDFGIAAHDDLCDAWVQAIDAARYYALDRWAARGATLGARVTSGAPPTKGPAHGQENNDEW